MNERVKPDGNPLILLAKQVGSAVMTPDDGEDFLVIVSQGDGFRTLGPMTSMKDVEEFLAGVMRNARRLWPPGEVKG